MATITVKARVVNVRPRGDETFGVTLGPGPGEIFWFCTPTPPDLGALVVVRNAEGRQMRVRDRGIVTLLEGGDMSVIEDPYARRVVDPRWVKRVHGIVRRPLMGYQAEGAGWLASRIASNRGAILGDEPGLGKTTQVLSAIAAVGAFPAIVVCPTSVKRNWARELRYLRPRLRASIISGMRGPLHPGHVFILNYALLRGRERQLSMLRAKTIIFDEAHLLKEPKPSARHRAAVATRIAHRIGRPILLTGSPVLNRPQELWRLLHIIDREEWAEFEDYNERYCTSPKEDDARSSVVVTEHGQAKYVDELRVRTSPYILRRRSTRVLASQLPPKTQHQHLVKLEEIDRRNYREAERDVVKWIRGFAGDAKATKAAKGQAVVKLNMLRRIAAIGKLRRAVADYIRRWFDDQGRPLVVFAYHKQVLNGTEFICNKLGLKTSRIKGNDSDKKRQLAVDQFQAGQTDVFLAPLRSAGVGINLQHRCSDILCLERLWTPTLMGQAEGRCWRLGQRNPVTITYLDAEDTVDMHIAAVLKAKQRLIDAVVDGSLKNAPSRSAQLEESVNQVIARLGERRGDMDER